MKRFYDGLDDIDRFFADLGIREVDFDECIAQWLLTATLGG